MNHQGLAPMRWLDQVPYGRDFRKFSDAGPRSPVLAERMIAIGHITQSDGLLQHDYQRAAIVELSRLQKHEGMVLEPTLVTEAIVSSDVAVFHAYGRQVLHLSESLAEELSQTDVDDIPCEEVHPPHIAFYLTWDKAPGESGIDNVQGLLVAGTANVPGHLQITAMTMQDDRAVALDVGYIDLSMGGAIKDAIAATMDEAKGQNLSSPNDGNIISEGFRLHSQRQYSGAHRLQQAARLLINAMLYVSQVDRGSLAWPPGAPKDLVDKADGETGAAKAEQKLIKQGWTRVRIFDLPSALESQEKGNGCTRRAHWRRGHWRRQRHGPQRKLITRKWIRPVRVSGSGEVEGRIYSLEHPPSS